MRIDVRPLRDLDDEVLVDRSRGRDRAAFEELVRRYADRLYAVVLRLCTDAHEAEEVTQEAFLRAWRGIERFEDRSQFFTWLYRIGVNEAKRRSQRRPPAGQVPRSTRIPSPRHPIGARLLSCARSRVTCAGSSSRRFVRCRPTTARR